MIGFRLVLMAEDTRSHECELISKKDNVLMEVLGVFSLGRYSGFTSM